jgi:hypothetical protein
MSPHGFLVDGTWPPEMIRYEGRYDEVAIEAAQLALKGGVTTVFDTWGPRDPLIRARSAIADGRPIAARIYLCGNWVGLGGPYSPDMRPNFREAVGDPFAERNNALFEVNVGEELTRMPVEEMRQEVRQYVQTGIDFVAYPVNLHRTGASQFIVFSLRVQRMIVEEAHNAGLPVAAMFVTTEEGIHLALDAGADMVFSFQSRGKAMSVETLASIAQRGIAFYTAVAPTDDLEWYRRQRSPDVAVREAADLDHRGLIRAGAFLIASSPSGVFTEDQIKAWGGWAPGAYAQLGEGHVRGLQALQQKGMTPMGALMTATRNVARAFKVDKDLGTLEPGKLADLVVLNSNPLDDPQNYLDIHLVMKEGKVIDRDALPTQMLRTALSQSSGRRSASQGDLSSNSW